MAEATSTAAKPRATKATVETDERTVVQRMLDIAAEVGVLEPSKSGGVPFAFRGVDATVAHLTPMLNKHGVLVVPTVDSHLVTQREAGNKVITKTEVEVTYTFYGAKGDTLVSKSAGQADDFADRSTAQAMSVAYRVALLQAFHIAAFGNEEAHSEGVKNDREAAGQSAVDKVRGQSAPAPAAAAIRNQILAVAGPKGIEGEGLNSMATEVTGLALDDWWENVEALNKILKAVQEAPEK